MSLALPKLRVGEPVRHETLAVFPLFAEANSEIGYRLSDEALSDQTVLVEEVSQGGSVPDLLVENKGDLRVLFLEGEELVGAKQNRVLNTSVLIPAHSKLPIPVSCVERGRWRYSSHYFAASGSHSPSKLRRALKSSVTESLKMSRGHTSDQGEVWKQVDSLHETHRISSETAALSDAFDTYQDRITDFKQRLQYIDGALGLAVSISGKIVSVDLFDKPTTCQKVWDRLLSGVVFDVLEARGTEQEVSVSAVEELLALASDLPWEPTATVGEGQEFRAESKRGDYASALVFEGAFVHGSLITAS